MNLLDTLSFTESNFIFLFANNMYKKNNMTTKAISYIANSYNECSLAFFKMISGKFILASMNLLDKDSKLIIKDFFKHKIETAHFPSYFKSLKNIIVSEKVDKDEIEIHITAQNIDIVNNIIRYLLMLEKEHDKNDIELKFSTALLQLTLQLYPAEKFKEIINNSHGEIIKLNEGIITCLIENA